MLCFVLKEYRELRRKLLKQQFWPGKPINYWSSRLSKGENYYIYKFLLNLRIYESLIKKKTTIPMKLIRFWHLRQYQKYAGMLGYVIGDGVLGEDVVFYHRGSIIINPAARIGEGCKFHGDACIGVARTGETGCPVLGKRVDIGIGARVLGDIYIADDIVIGANAVVTKSFHEPGITIAGIPARKVKDAE